MHSPSAKQALKIIDELVNKTLNTQSVFERAIQKLLNEATRIKGSVEDVSMPLSNYQTRQILLNVSYIIREIGMVEKGFEKTVPEELYQQMLHKIEAGTMKQ